MKPLQDYTIAIHPNDNGTFVAYVPAIPGCHAWGQTSAGASAELANVFDMIREEYTEAGQSLPLDVEVVVANVSSPFLETGISCSLTGA